VTSTYPVLVALFWRPQAADQEERDAREVKEWSGAQSDEPVASSRDAGVLPAVLVLIQALSITHEGIHRCSMKSCRFLMRISALAVD
jgi:hypothetical protein